MEITYLFPVFKEDDSKKFFKGFLETKFFRAQKNAQILVFVAKDDEKNLKAVKSLSRRNKIFKVETERNNFTYNSVFKKAIGLVKGDVLLLGDLKVSNIDLLFEKCVEKKNSGANIVFVKKRYVGIKNFFVGLMHNFYNFFIKIFTGKKDRFNVISLGLYDKDVLDVFRALSEKSLFLKNTKDLFGFVSRTLYIDEKVKTYKINFFKKTFSFISAITASTMFFAILILSIFLNIFCENMPLWFNFFAVFGALLSFAALILFFPKHFFDLRNDEKEKNEN